MFFVFGFFFLLLFFFYVSYTFSLSVFLCSALLQSCLIWHRPMQCVHTPLYRWVPWCACMGKSCWSYITFTHTLLHYIRCTSFFWCHANIIYCSRHKRINHNGLLFFLFIKLYFFCKKHAAQSKYSTSNSLTSFRCCENLYLLSSILVNNPNIHLVSEFYFTIYTFLSSYMITAISNGYVLVYNGWHRCCRDMASCVSNEYRCRDKHRECKCYQCESKAI